MPRISIVIPWHFMENWEFFLNRCLKSIEQQTFKDYEVILVKHSTMPVTSNRAIESAQGELIKVLYMDDYLAHENSLKEIVYIFDSGEPHPDSKGRTVPILNSFHRIHWLVSGCVHDDGKTVGNYHEPKWTDNISTGNNCIGSPSVLTMRREGAILFDARLSWLLDCDLYQRLYDSYGPPVLLNTPNVCIGIHSGQTTYKLSDTEKQEEHEYLRKKYA